MLKIKQLLNNFFGAFFWNLLKTIVGRIRKLNCLLKKKCSLKLFVCAKFHRPAKVNKNNRAMCEICSKLRIKISKRCHSFFPVFLLSILNRFHTLLIVDFGQVNLRWDLTNPKVIYMRISFNLNGLEIEVFKYNYYLLIFTWSF